MRMRDIPYVRTFSKRQYIAMGFLFLAYIITAQIGTLLFTSPAVIFPAAAIALSGLVLGGIALWPAIVAASVLVNLLNGFPIIVSLFLAAGHALHAVGGAYALQKMGFDPVFRRVRDMFTFMIVAFLGAAIVPTVGFLGLFVGNGFSFPTAGVTWFSWWTGIMLSDLILASTIMRWFSKPHFTRAAREWVELALVFTILITSSIIVYWTDTERFGGVAVILVYLIPFVWLVLRLGMRFTLLGFLATTVIGITGVLHGNNPSEMELGYRLLTTEIFLATLAVIFYLFVTVMEEWRRAARELNAQLDRIKGLLDKVQAEDSAKNEFLAIFSHELRNPLAPIVSSIELLKMRLARNPDNSETSQIIDIVDDRVRTIVRLLDDLLDISRISQKKLNLRMEDFDVRAIIRRAMQSANFLAEKRNISLAADLLESPLMLRADPVRVEQILLNLLNNAKKYTDPGGSIIIAARRIQNEARISIKDTGIGIEPHLLQRIFEPFLQLERTPRPQAVNDGLGIGLSLTKQLVEMHGGSIEAKSDGLGKGSEFIVHLPIGETVTTPTPILLGLQASAPINVVAKHVLVVDDNTSAARSLGMLLETLGHTIVYAENGTDAITKTREHVPGVIILDIGLPDLSGYDVAEKLRTNIGFSGTLIALTGYGQEEDKQRALDAGFDHHLTKPIALAQIQSVLAA